MSGEDLRKQYAKALEPAQPFTDRLVDAMLAARDEEMERLRALAATCTCGTPGLDYEGPQEDCAVHGAVRAFNEATRENERLRAELARIETAIEAEREKTRHAEGATLRDENVINGIVNGLGIALRIVRGER